MHFIVNYSRAASLTSNKVMSDLEDDNSIIKHPLDAAHEEGFLFNYCSDLHRCEVEAHNRLKDLQGKNVPRFFADVLFDNSSTEHTFLGVRGILLEFIDGYDLTGIAKYAHRSSWQRICDEAIHTVNLISNYGILNEDAKPHNILVRTYNNLSKHDIVVIDFAQCRFREASQSEAAWRYEKW